MTIYDIITAPNSRKDNFYENALEKGMNKNIGFYNIVIKRPHLAIVPDRRTIDLLRGHKTEPYVIGWARQDNNTIYLLDIRHLETESDHKYSSEEHKKSAYESLITHEISHLFLLKLIQYSPRWFNEGLAIYISEQDKFRQRPSELKSFLEYYDTFGKEMYEESGFAIDFLIKEKSRHSLLKFISELSAVKNRQGFDKKFEENFGFAPSYENFNRLKDDAA